MTIESTDQDLQSAIAKLATTFSDAELHAVCAYLAAGDEDDDVVGFTWKPDTNPAAGLLQRVESHPGFKPLRLGFTPPTKGVVPCASPSGD